ncbi:MAG: hypothetical protein ACLQAT_06115 [Candidatus Binataceae bacterium]
MILLENQQFATDNLDLEAFHDGFPRTEEYLAHLRARPSYRVINPATKVAEASSSAAR